MEIEFLLEIGCEEIPARFIEGTLENLEVLFSSLLKENNLEYSELELFATPRRLILKIGCLRAKQEDRRELIPGPPISAAIDAQGNPTKAAEGFAKKSGVSFGQLHRLKTDKGEYLAFEKLIVGRTAREILAEKIPGIVGQIEFPKNMRWESSRFFFCRPVRWILCLLGGEVVSFELAGVKSSNFTFAHRILSNDKKIYINDYLSYKSSLLNNNVIIDPAVRRMRIEEELSRIAAEHDAVLIPDQSLVNTVVYLNESPSVVYGNFDPSYLKIPREVLITVMREHQKYFCLQDAQGKILPCFLAVVDSHPQYHDRIRQGHERVLRARLADAKFFWEVDNKIPLINRQDNLRQVVFQAKLGTLQEKALRLAKLSTTLAKFLQKKDLIPDLELAARLAKIDLTTDMVKEFTDLQGIMGGLYAQNQGFNSAVALAVYGHYKPLSFEDSSPPTIEAALLSIADKLDSVIGAFSIGLIPTGSRDPLALRRQTLGIIKIILDHQLDFSLKKLVAKSHSLFRKYAEKSLQETTEKYEEFVKERLVYIFKEIGYKYDEVNAVLAVDFDHPLDCQVRLEALSKMRSSQDFLSLANSYKRIKNIVVKAGLTAESRFVVDPLLFEQDEEKQLFFALSEISPTVRRLKKGKKYRRAFELIASLRPSIDAFFDKVLVMAENPAVQKNRLGLLGTIWLFVLEMADISEIVVS